MNTPLCHTVVILTAGLLASCGGHPQPPPLDITPSPSSSASVPPAPPSTIILSGRVVDAPAAIAGSTVSAYLADAAELPGAAIGSATTGADGTFSVKAVVPGGTPLPVDLILASRGGTYSSEADASIPLPTGRSALTVLLAQVGTNGSTGVVVSPLTTLVAARAQGIHAGAGAECPATPATCADEEIRKAFGVSKGPLAALAPDITATDGDGAVLALVLGALEEEAQALRLTPADLLAALAADYQDGIPDGKGAGGRAVTLPGTPTTASPDLGGALFLNGLSAYLADNSSPSASQGHGPERRASVLTSVVVAVRAGIAAVAPASARIPRPANGSVHLSADGRRIWAIASGSLITTADGGRSWATQDGPAALNDLYFMADGRRGWAVGDRVYATTDGGMTWGMLSSPVSRYEHLRSIHLAADAERGWALVEGMGGRVIKTSDGGRTWITQLSGGTWYSVFTALDGEHAAVVSWDKDGNYVWATANGASWVKHSRLGELFSVFLAVDGQHGWAVGEHGTVVATTDGFIESYFSQGTPTGETLRAVYAADNRRGWAVGDEGTVIATTDGGRSWFAQTTPTGSALNSVHFAADGLHGWAVADDGAMIATANGGKTWFAR